MELEEYLEATEFCDFDRDSVIGEKALQLTQGGADKHALIYQFVRELPYGLEDWEVKASETLSKGWGMCSGKTNLLVAMSRALGIPARYRVFKIRGEQRLWEWVTEQDIELAAQFGSPPLEQDHLECEVYLNGWHTYDSSRDSAFENGLKMLEIPLEREVIAGSVILLASIDEWVKERQRRRRFKKRRQITFSRANRQFTRIRLLGRDY